MAKSNINRGGKFSSFSLEWHSTTWSLFTRQVENSRHNNYSKITVRSNISLTPLTFHYWHLLIRFLLLLFSLRSLYFWAKWMIYFLKVELILYYENLDLVELWLPTELPLTPWGGGFALPMVWLKSWLTMTPFLQLVGRKQGYVLLHVRRRPVLLMRFGGHCSAGIHYCPAQWGQQFWLWHYPVSERGTSLLSDQGKSRLPTQVWQQVFCSVCFQFELVL